MMRKIRCSHSPYNLEEVTLIKIHAYACKQLLQMFQQRYHVMLMIFYVITDMTKTEVNRCIYSAP